jgi:hypothetical protein
MCSTNQLVSWGLVLFLFSYVAQGQDNLTGYWQPQIGVNYKVSNNYSHNFSLAKRTFILRDSDTEFTIRQLDLAHFSNLKIRGNQSVGLGIQYRFRGLFDDTAENELRLIQQYNITKSNRGLRFGNRFRSEQRITNSLTIHRFRYRFALDFPLQGQSLDIGETYLVLSTESLLSVAKASLPEYDQRITANLGWVLDEKTKLQVGTEYRAENYTNETEHVFFFLTTLVLSL